MALFQCVDCGKDVSTLSAACPNCGRPTDSHQPELPDEKERIACPEGRCTGTIGEEGTCRTCGKATNWKDDEEETRESGKTPTKDRTQDIIAVLITCIIVIAFGFLIHHETSDPPPKIRTAEDTQTMAAIQCKGFVKAYLKSPATADFPWADYTATPLGDGTYSVRSYVDAQNSFGATIRSNYTCVVKYLGGDDAYIGNWQLINMQIK